MVIITLLYLKVNIHEKRGEKSKKCYCAKKDIKVSINFDNIPEKALDLARKYSRKCRFNDVGLDFIKSDGRWYLIEANMKYGRKGLKMKGMNLKEIIREKLLSGEL